MARRTKKYLQLTGSQAKNDLSLQTKAGGAGSGFDLSRKLAAGGDSKGALAAAARVAAIRKARASGDRKGYIAAVQENRVARLGYNQKALGLHGNGYGKGAKDTGVSVQSKKRVKRGIAAGRINARTQRGVIG